MELQNVLFDFDGTLANTLPLTIFAMQKVFKKYDGQSYDGHEIVSMFGPPEEEMVRKNLKNQSAALDAVDLYFILYEEEHDRYVEKNAEIFNMLGLLKDMGIRIGLITGKARRSFLISEEKLGFKDIFDSVITGNDVVNPKPDPEGIKQTLIKFEADPAKSIYIGDANGDILAGKAAGIHTAAVQWLEMSQSDSYPANPEFYWTKVSQFVELLKNDH
ncbi:HAD-IA family hydrolase [Sporolactobacillus shoreicorticis]|uniref:HAD family hydrolase n=1 Tax=Sporolactobacillus shoreicorticis TaxID=1923877 RepID=A0ABW5S612_9BACL|nr:HAD-IA family hydrolase [Sporolactobacillus shoreicorticis]MCO7125729.1 HAD-IA family hydrolase [Sporolactobacillus shoreicorticis]